MIVIVPTPPPSKEAVYLGKRIAEAVRILRAENPSLRREDVRRGFQIAQSELRAEFGGPDRRIVLAVLLLAALAFGGWLAYFIGVGGKPSPVLLVAGTSVSVILCAVAITLVRK